MRRAARGMATVLLIGGVALTGCAPPMVGCPLIGFVYSDPVELRISGGLADGDSVSACLREGCDPAPVAPRPDGSWIVPQEPPYARGGAMGIVPGEKIRVAITSRAGEILQDEWLEIPYTSVADDPCPVPVTFQPVVIPSPRTAR